MKKFICYMRVSTSKQEHGKDAQLASAQAYVKGVGGKIILKFSENASGKNDNRVELANAIAACKEHGAVLLIAKLDRLSRNARFLFQLKDELSAANVEVVAADMPEVLSNTLMLSVMAGMAQHEREIISKRTKDGLKAAKAKGVKLGRKPGFTVPQDVRDRIAKGNRAKSHKYPEMVVNLANSMRDDGKTLQEIADKLNDLKATAPQGGKLSPVHVQRLTNPASEMNKALKK